MHPRGRIHISVVAAALLAVLVPAQAPASGDSADCRASHGTALRDGVLGGDFAPDGRYVAVGAVEAGTAPNITVGDAWGLKLGPDGLVEW